MADRSVEPDDAPRRERDDGSLRPVVGYAIVLTAAVFALAIVLNFLAKVL